MNLILLLNEQFPRRDGERKLKLYHSFPFRSCRCAWLVHELAVKDEVEFIPVALHGSNPADLKR